MRRSLLTLVVAGALVAAGPARAEPPPSPPPDHPPATVAAGTSWTAPLGGGLCLDQPAWTYQVELRRYYEVRIRAGEQVAEGQLWRGLWWGAGIGVAVGILVGALVAR